MNQTNILIYYHLIKSVHGILILHAALACHTRDVKNATFFCFIWHVPLKVRKGEYLDPYTGATHYS